MDIHSVSVDIGGKTITIETGKYAKQAHGSVTIRQCDSIVLCTAVSGHTPTKFDFMPLTVEYMDRTAAYGKIPGGFFKREGRPTTKETLTMRLIDRAIRPMFPEGFYNEVQVMTHALSYDGRYNTDIAAMIAAFAATRISGLPVQETLGAVRIGHLDGELMAFPTDDRRREESKLDLVVAGHRNGICMVESSAKELTEAEMLRALEMAQDVILQIVEMCEELNAKAGKEPMVWAAPVRDEKLWNEIRQFASALDVAVFTHGKHARYAAIDAIKADCVEKLTSGILDEEQKDATTKAVKSLFGELVTEREREMILQGKRTDGRKLDEVREITIMPNFIPRQHGSVLFTRGETQALVSCTLGTPDDEQIIDGLVEE